MNKKIVIGIMLVMLVGSVFLSGCMSETVDGKDDYYSISFHKDYTVFKLPSNLEDGEQYEFIMVDKFLPISEREPGSYGFLRVNESTGLIEFIKWRTSNTSNIQVTWINESTNISDYDVWINFGWRKP